MDMSLPLKPFSQWWPHFQTLLPPPFYYIDLHGDPLFTLTRVVTPVLCGVAASVWSWRFLILVVAVAEEPPSFRRSCMLSLPQHSRGISVKKKQQIQEDLLEPF